MTSAVREEVTRAFATPHYEVLIIGGGINGLATFRDLALQGVQVLLVERGDFGSGASSASSHMIHGGIRYLENGEFRLVRESVQERNGLLRTAPHYVRPLPTTIPIESTFSGILAAPLRLLTHRQRRPKARGALLIKVGLTIYDLFSRDGGSLPRHRFHGRKASHERLPQLASEVKYTATYFDASLRNPERLALDVAMDGVRAGDHAQVLNYVEAIEATPGGIVLRDRESGEQAAISADVIVNASGPWTDLTNAALGSGSDYLGGTKGSHIVLDHPELLAATGGNEIFFEHDDGRIVLVYPLNGRVLVGTTDLEADPRQPAICTEEEVDYFFDLIHQVFPRIPVAREQIVYRYSGIRPLPRHDDLAPGFVSRDYRIVTTPTGPGGAPVLNLVGGKWTTFRALGEHLSGQVLAQLGRERTISTVGLAIGGGRDYPGGETAVREWIRRNLGALDPERAERLFERYGTRAAEVAEFIESDTDTPVSGNLSTRELQYMAETERVAHLSDILLRRTTLAFTGGASDSVIDEIAAALAPALEWDAGRIAAEIAAVRDELTRLHGLHWPVDAA